MLPPPSGCVLSGMREAGLFIGARQSDGVCPDLGVSLHQISLIPFLWQCLPFSEERVERGEEWRRASPQSLLDLTAWCKGDEDQIWDLALGSWPAGLALGRSPGARRPETLCPRSWDSLPLCASVSPSERGE